MTKELNQKLINTWEWLNTYCLSKRGDQDLACGQHAVCIVQIDDFNKKKQLWGSEMTREVLKELEDVISTFALEDTLIARYNESTFVVILHHIVDRKEINDICVEIKEAISEAALGGENPLTVSIGAAECHHDQTSGYQCAMSYALDALMKAQNDDDSISISDMI